MSALTLQRLRWLGVGTASAGILALIAITLHWPVFVIVGAIALSALSGFLLTWRVEQLKRSIDHANHALGTFIRGSFDARIIHIHGLDTLGKLQHRINNLLDIVDLAMRRDEAAVDTGDDEVYLSKLSNSALFDALKNEPVLEIPVQLNVSPLLSQIEQLQQGVDQARATSRSLLQRMEHTSVAPDARDSQQLASAIRKTVDHARNAPHAVKDLHSALEKIAATTSVVERLAERGEILALNMAISSARAGGDERINTAVASVRLLADQTRDAKDHIAGSLAEMHHAAHAAMRMIYDIANLIHHINQAYATTQRSGTAQVNGHGDSVTFLSDVKQAVMAADDLHDRAVRLDERIKQLGEAA